MEAKLIKVDDVYRLVEATKHGNSIIGTTDLDYQKAWSDRCHKLSLKNCQAIERGYDLDEIKRKVFSGFDGCPNSFTMVAVEITIEIMMDLMGNKKFSEEDMKSFAQNYYREIRENTSNLLWDDLADKCMKEHIQSLQQTEWDVVVEMQEESDTMIDDVKTFLEELGDKPKRDADGCLILKRI